MDRPSVDGADEKQLTYTRALEFIGEIRAGISWERFCLYAIQHFDALLDFAAGSEEAERYLSAKHIDREYVLNNVKNIFQRLHFNRADDHYLTLGLSHTATEAQLHKRWRDLMSLYHPDRNRDGDKKTDESAKKINEAYAVLKDPAKRSSYDEKMRRTAGVHSSGTFRSDRHASGSRDPLPLSPAMRRILPRAVIPVTLLISVLILIIVFVQNRPTKTLMKSIAQVSTPREQTGKETAREPGVLTTPVPPRPESAETRTPAQQPENALQPALEKQGAKLAARKAEKPLATAGDAGGSQKREEPPALRAGTHNDLTPPKPEAQQPFKPAQEPAVEAERKPLRPEGLQAQTAPASVAVAQQQAVPWDVEQNVILFIGQYINAYEKGDIEGFMNLYSTSAIEKGSMRYDEIRSNYQRHFKDKRYIYLLQNFQIQPSGDKIIVTGTYHIRSLTNDDSAQTTSGNIRWTLSKERDALKITRVDYDRV